MKLDLLKNEEIARVELASDPNSTSDPVKRSGTGTANDIAEVLAKKETATIDEITVNETVGTDNRYSNEATGIPRPTADCDNSPDPAGHVSWVAQVKSWQTPQDALACFERIGIPGEQWKNSQSFARIAKLPKEQGGAGKTYAGLLAAISIRFTGFRQFVAWMDNKEMPETWGKKKVKECETPQDFLRLFEEIGIPADMWKISSWLMLKSKLPKENGGIGKQLTALYQAIRKRFGGHTNFVAWMEGKREPDKTWIEKVEGAKTSEDFLIWFAELGIPGDKWKNSQWLARTAKLPVEAGGIEKVFGGLCTAINRRFGTHRKFVAWMEGKDKPEEKLGKKQIDLCDTPEDFLRLFAETGIPGDKWKNSGWLRSNARQPKEAGGAGKNLGGLISAIKNKFGSHRRFVAWMNGKEETGKIKIWGKKDVDRCKTPEDFRRLFAEIGIPGTKWKSGNWLGNISKLPEKEDGIHKALAGLRAGITERFTTYPKFVAWMEGKDKPDETWIEKVNACKTPQDLLMFFGRIGIPGNMWKSSQWLSKKAKLPKEEGGIGLALAGLYEACKQRFGGFQKFVAWMEGTPLPKINSPEDAADIIRSEAARLGVLTEDLLDPEKVSTHVRNSPALKEALNYFASPSSDHSHEA